MKILLKSNSTGLYLARGGKWTDQPEAALAFLDEVRANDHSIYHGLPDTQVVVLAEPGAANASSARIATNETENMATKTNQIKKQAEPKVGQVKATKEPSLTYQVSELAEKPAGIKPTQAKSQTSHKAATAEPRTMVQAKIDVGFGNALFIRGEGGGLSWDKGQPLTCVDSTSWHWSSKPARDKVVFKLLLNDTVWAKGENVEVEPGKVLQVVPEF